MAAEYLANAVQEIALNAPAIFTASIPCRRGYIYHEDETGIFILRGITNQCFATYQVTFNGEPRLTSRAVFTPAAAEEFGNVTSTAIIRVPRGCCFSLSVESVPATTDPTVTPAPVIEMQNANLVINRIA